MSFVRLYNQTLGLPYQIKTVEMTTTKNEAINLSSGAGQFYNSSYEGTPVSYSHTNGTPSNSSPWNYLGGNPSGFAKSVIDTYGVMACAGIKWNSDHMYVLPDFPNTGAYIKVLNRDNAYNLINLFPPDDFSKTSGTVSYFYNLVNVEEGEIDFSRTIEAKNTYSNGSISHSLRLEYDGVSWTPFTFYTLAEPNSSGLTMYGNDFIYLAEPKKPFFSVEAVPTGISGFVNTNRVSNGNSIAMCGTFHSWIMAFFNPGAVIDEDTNDQGGNSGTGGGGGNFDDTSDQIPIPSLPTLSATKAGFVTLYKPTLQELINLAQFLWSDNPLEWISKYFNNPMDIIVGLGIVPVDAPANGTSQPSAGTIVYDEYLHFYDSQYYEHSCGSIEVNEYWGSALDYAPYTKCDIYLPYIGVRSLNVDEIMGHTVGVVYHVDLYGGAIVAFVTVDGSVRYQFSGNCMQQVPVNASNYDSLVQNLVSLACVVGTGVAAAGAAGAAAAVGEEAATIGAGELSHGAAVAKGLTSSQYSDVRALGFKEWAAEGGGKALANCTVSSIMSAKPTVERTGSVSATTGQLALQTPFIILTRPNQSLPVNYKHYGGYPSNITARLGDLSGFTVVDSIRINDLAATEPELVEIYSLLKKGVII